MDDTVKINEIKIDDAVYSPLGKETKEISSKKTSSKESGFFLYPKSNFFWCMLSKAFLHFLHENVVS